MFDRQALLNARMHALVVALRGEITGEAAALVDEMVEANESPIALDVLSEALAERSAVVAPEIVSEFEALSEELGLGPEVAGRLRS